MDKAEKVFEKLSQNKTVEDAIATGMAAEEVDVPKGTVSTPVSRSMQGMGALGALAGAVIAAKKGKSLKPYLKTVGKGTGVGAGGGLLYGGGYGLGRREEKIDTALKRKGFKFKGEEVTGIPKKYRQRARKWMKENS